LKYDRRYNERYPLPAAKVRYKVDENEVHGKSVKDITHSGVCIEFSHSTEVGSQIEIELTIPGKDSLVLKGNIVWTGFQNADKAGYAGMQFLPFGTDERYNTMDDHDKLRKLIMECIEENPPNIKFRI
jgi:hypothetical protein